MHNSRCVGANMNCPFVLCLEEVVQDHRFGISIDVDAENDFRFADKPYLNYCIVASQFDVVWFFDLHEYWAPDCCAET